MVSDGLISLLKELGSSIERLQEISTDPAKKDKTQEDVFLFFSLDLTDSTRFKNEHPQLWPKVISAFYDVVFEQYGVENYQSTNSKVSEVGGIQFWKFIGDEVLLYARIYNYKDVYALIQATDECIHQIPNLIDKKLKYQDGCIDDCNGRIKGNQCNHYLERIQKCSRESIICNSLGVKATIWMALCGHNASDCRNIIHLTETDSGFWENEKQDFLGPEIDEGFRISKYAVKNRVLVSPFLANSLFEYGDEKEEDFKMIVQNNFRIISFQRLKGIWNERPFPIIMYSSQFQDFYELAEYDELALPVYENIRNDGLEKFLTDSRYSMKRLKKILSEVHLESEILRIKERFSDPEYIQKPNSVKAKHINNELHVACACFSKDGKLLIIHHPTRGWEFGCIQILETNNWADAIKKGYKKKYDLDIDVKENPVPVATYTYCKSEERKNKTALGLIVIAEVGLIQKENFRFISEDEIDSLMDEKTVDNFCENAHKSFKVRGM